MDSAGTLTQNKISVHRLVTPNKMYAFGQGDGPSPGAELKYLRRIMALCNNATSDNGKFAGDSTDIALLACVLDMEDVDRTSHHLSCFMQDVDDDGATTEDFEAYHRVSEKPFSSATKYQITVCQKPNEDYESYLKGAPETVLAMCDRIMGICGKPEKLGERGRKWFNTALTSLASKGERCLGLAYRPVDECDPIQESNFIFVAIVGMM